MAACPPCETGETQKNVLKTAINKLCYTKFEFHIFSCETDVKPCDASIFFTILSKISNPDCKSR